MLQKLQNSVVKGGIVIATATPNIGLLATTLRAALAYRLTSETSVSFEEKTEILESAFGSHLNTLSDMSRPHVDWIHDNLLNPANLREIIHPVELLELFNDTHLLGTYPQIFESWSWYKSLYGSNMDIRHPWINQYYSKSHNFIDLDEPTANQSIRLNKELEHYCLRASERVIELREHQQPDADLLSIVDGLLKYVPNNKAKVSSSIGEWMSVYKQNTISFMDVANMTDFRQWFGRELLYMSFIRR